MGVALTFTCLWILPNTALNIILIFFPLSASGAVLLRMTHIIGRLFIYLIFILLISIILAITGVLNGCLNFALYVWRHHDFRRYILHTLRRFHNIQGTHTNAITHVRQINKM
jgi:hypothetical protein